MERSQLVAIAGRCPSHEPGLITVANAITAARALLLPVLIFLYFQGSHRAVFIVMIVIIVSDWLDGRVARAMNQAGRTGMYLDARLGGSYPVRTGSNRTAYGVRNAGEAMRREGIKLARERL